MKKKRICKIAVVAMTVVVSLLLPGILALSNNDASTNSVTNEVTASADASTAIYLNGSSGNDSNDGLTTDTALKTFSAAKTLAATLDSQTDETITIYITGTVSISGDISLDGIDAIVKRYSGYSGALMNVAKWCNSFIIVHYNRWKQH
ncbi:MAG: hypothetical protein ACOYJJ_05230 [Anaerovoracaceae bacterium]|jgi:hypothetical protein